MLITSSAFRLQVMLDTCERYSLMNGCGFSPTKSEIIAPQDGNSGIFKLYDQEIK